jgi:hypothetical protein
MWNSEAKQTAAATSNRDAARIIAGEPNRYPGLIPEWAQLVLH